MEQSLARSFSCLTGSTNHLQISHTLHSGTRLLSKVTKLQWVYFYHIDCDRICMIWSGCLLLSHQSATPKSRSCLILFVWYSHHIDCVRLYLYNLMCLPPFIMSKCNYYKGDDRAHSTGLSGTICVIFSSSHGWCQTLFEWFGLSVSFYPI